jgi:hypothetical protein
MKTKLPFEPCYWLTVVLKSKLISPYSQEIVLFNDFLSEQDKLVDYHVYSKALNYTIAMIKYRNKKDAKGHAICSSFYYFKTALLSNIERVINNQKDS